MTKEILGVAIDWLKKKGVDYGDIRWVKKTSEYVRVKNGKVEVVTKDENEGFGIRVLIDGAWGFAASPIINEANLLKIAEQALEIAKASRLVIKEKVKLSDEEPYVDSYKTQVLKDAFQIPLDTKLDLLFRVDKSLKKDGIKIRDSALYFWQEEKNFMNTEGAKIDQIIVHTGAAISATAVEGNELQKRSFEDYGAKGYEFVEELNLSEKADRISDEVLQLIKAPECPSGEKDIIISGDQLALQVHESCGHPIELDRVLGTEAGFYGTSFLTLDKLGKFYYGSKHVNITANATQGDALGGFGYDDEGVKAQKFPIVREGKFVGYLTSRETAPVIGQRSNGAMRASNWDRIPLIRMTSIDLEPGEWDLEDLIRDTKDGILFETNKSWSIDEKRLNFQFGTEIAWEIKNGKKTRMLKNPVYTGITPEFWRSCDAVCNKNYWHNYGIPSCGKGEPEQGIHVSHGTAPARFRKVKVFGRST